MTAGFNGLAPCVHCGFCLQTCPTYLETGDEAEGPRGRILLMQGLARGEIAPTEMSATQHLDTCLGCRACEPVCPSGVAFGPALEEARFLIAQRTGVSVLTRFLLTLLTDPLWSRATLLGAQLLRPVARFLAGTRRVGFALGMLAATRVWARAVRPYRAYPDGVRHHRGTVAGAHAVRRAHAVRPYTLFLGCVQRGLFGHVHAATRRTLHANDVTCVDVRGQGCCGALHAHAGLREDAIRLAMANVRAFAAEPDATIVVNAAGCGAMLRSYGELLHDTPMRDEAHAFAARVRDVSEVLTVTGPRVGAPLDLRVAYDPPCHLVHAQRVIDPPLTVLEAIPELQLVMHEDQELCCGSAGLYSTLQPDTSRAVLKRKLRALADVQPDVVATGNPGCIMHIGAGLRAARTPIPVVHPVELLDRSYALAGYYERDG